MPKHLKGIINIATTKGISEKSLKRIGCGWIMESEVQNFLPEFLVFFSLKQESNKLELKFTKIHGALELWGGEQGL